MAMQRTDVPLSVRDTLVVVVGSGFLAPPRNDSWMLVAVCVDDDNGDEKSWSSDAVAVVAAVIAPPRARLRTLDNANELTDADVVAEVLATAATAVDAAADAIVIFWI